MSFIAMLLVPSEAQQKAIDHHKGNLLIIAGPGTGKTSIIAKKAALLILDKKMKPSSVLIISRNNQTLADLQQKLETEFLTKNSDSKNIPSLHTFQSLAIFVLKKISKKPFFILNAKQQFDLITTIIKSQKIQLDLKQITNIQRILNASKNSGVDFNTLEPPQGVTKEAMRTIYEEYESKKISQNSLDLADLIIKASLVLKNDSIHKDTLKQDISHLLIDDYQDIQESEYEFIKQLFEPSTSQICAMGDSQHTYNDSANTIHKFFFRFSLDFANTTIIHFEQNYRSSDGIVDQIMSNYDNEADFMAKEIRRLCQSSPFSDFAILYDSQSKAELYEEALKQQDIPCHILGKNSWYKSKEAQILTHLIRLIIQPTHDDSLLTLLQNGPHQITKETLKTIQKTASKKQTSLFLILSQSQNISKLNPKDKEVLNQIVQNIFHIQRNVDNLNPIQSIKLIIHTFQLKDYWGIYNDCQHPAYQNIISYLKTLKSLKDKKGFEGLHSALDCFALFDSENYYQQKKPAVQIIPLQYCQGLEFPYVFIGKVEKKPTVCLFTAMHRAQKRLYLSQTLCNSKQLLSPQTGKKLSFEHV